MYLACEAVSDLLGFDLQRTRLSVRRTLRLLEAS